jgi:hypothetical protein
MSFVVRLRDVDTGTAVVSSSGSGYLLVASIAVVTVADVKPRQR